MINLKSPLCKMIIIIPNSESYCFDPMQTVTAAGLAQGCLPTINAIIILDVLFCF